VLIKPNDSCCGKNIRVESWLATMKSPPTFDAVVQQYISSKRAQSIRVVTYKTPTEDARVLQSYRVVNDEEKAIASNRGKVCPIINDRITITKELCKCHTEEFANMPAIAWDIVTDNAGREYVLEGNVPGAICWKHDCEATLARFDAIVREWL